MLWSVCEECWARGTSEEKISVGVHFQRKMTLQSCLDTEKLRFEINKLKISWENFKFIPKKWKMIVCGQVFSSQLYLINITKKKKKKKIDRECQKDFLTDDRLLFRAMRLDSRRNGEENENLRYRQTEWENEKETEGEKCVQNFREKLKRWITKRWVLN